MREYQLKQKIVMARVVTEDCVINCYNGDKIAFAGDYEVIDDKGLRTIIRRRKFESRYVSRADTHESKEHP